MKDLDLSSRTTSSGSSGSRSQTFGERRNGPHVVPFWALRFHPAYNCSFLKAGNGLNEPVALCLDPEAPGSVASKWQLARQKPLRGQSQTASAKKVLRCVSNLLKKVRPFLEKRPLL